MACENWKTKIEAYVDEELAHEEATALQAHLRACPDCAADVLNQMQWKRAVRSAGKRFSPSPEFRRKMQSRISRRSLPARVWRWVPGFALAAALAALVVVSALGIRRYQRRQTYAEIADLHVATLASTTPVDVASSDRHTVKPWFEGKLPFTFNVPELQGSPFVLLGGRLAYLHQAPGAQLLFQVRKHRISVFIFQDRSELSRGLAASGGGRQLTFTVQTWSQGGLRYIVISDAGADDIRALSDLLKNAP